MTDPTSLEKLKPASFSVSSRVALQLGRESISGSVTAIVELVKNSYDADAENVNIRFANLNSNSPYLVIEDTGEGMNESDLRNNWLLIGTANKTKNRTTKKKRSVTGEKGLGRLGLDRLSSITQVESIKENASGGIRLDIHWKKYEVEDTSLETILHDVYLLPNLSIDPITQKEISYPKGTRLILRDLKDEWDQDSIAELRKELSLLVSPFQAPNDFTITLDTGGVWEKLEGAITIEEPILDAANWRVEASLDDEHNMQILMTSSRHNVTYKLDPTPWSDAIKKQGEIPACGPLKMEFYFFVRREAVLAEKTLKQSQISEFLEYNQGVRIYRDGFRVKPYGEPDGDGDWLRLAYRRMQNPEGVAQRATPGTWRVGYNQIVGAVFITQENNPSLNDQTNREGLLQGRAFDHLKIFANRVIQFFEFQNQIFEIGKKYERTSAEEAETKAKTSIEEVDIAIEELTRLTESIPTPDHDKPSTIHDNQDRNTQQIVNSLKLRLENVSSELKVSTKLFLEADAQKNTMANLASLGILAASFGHETLDWTGTVLKNSNWLRSNLATGLFMVKPDVEAEVVDVLKDTVNEASKINKFALFTLGNLSRNKRIKKNFSLTSTIKRVFNAFDEVIKIQRNINIDLEGIPKDECLINGYEMDWESIFVNLITNSSWALETIDAAQRRIIVNIQSDISNWIIRFSDSGVGIEANTEDMIFMPAFSTKRDKRGQYIGTGMGLFIVKSFVEDHAKGSIKVIPKGTLGGATFEITVPKSNT